MRIAVVGATGMVGNVMLQVLAKSSINITELIPVASKRSVGKAIQFKGKQYTIVGMQAAMDKKADIAIFSALVASFSLSTGTNYSTTIALVSVANITANLLYTIVISLLALKH